MAAQEKKTEGKGAGASREETKGDDGEGGAGGGRKTFTDGFQCGARLAIGQKEGWLRRAAHVGNVLRQQRGVDDESNRKAGGDGSVMGALASEHTLHDEWLWRARDSVLEASRYKINDETLLRLRSFLKRYEGTNNYHNYTSHVQPDDPSCNRYIISFTAGDPVIIRGIEFIPLRVQGQSFMLNQIRRMVGLGGKNSTVVWSMWCARVRGYCVVCVVRVVCNTPYFSYTNHCIPCPSFDYYLQPSILCAATWMRTKPT